MRASMVGRAPSVLRFAQRAAFLIPHREKAQRGGEDGFFLTPDGRTVGIADGVGGWAASGVNPAFFTWSLMRNALKHSAAAGAGVGSLEVLHRAYIDTMSTRVPGSCTTAVARLVAAEEGAPPLAAEDGGEVEATRLSLALVGDCGIMVLRDGQVAYRSKEQQVDFNFPVQLGPGTTPSSGLETAIDVHPRDVVVLGSDGLFDNVFDEVLIAAVRDAPRLADGTTLDCAAAAKAIAELAAKSGRQEKGLSPFAIAAQRAGYRYEGGKEDDVAVVVAEVDVVTPPGDEAAVKLLGATLAEEFFAAQGVKVPLPPRSKL